MPWTPKFDLLPVTAFIPNLKTVFERDYGDALAHYGGGETLRNLQAVNTARQVSQQWPVLNLLPYGNDPGMNQGTSLLNETPRLLCEFETVSRVANSLAVHLVKYVTAGRSVLYEMTVADLTKNIVQGQRAGFNWSIGNERYGERYYEAENLWTMVGSVVLTINYTQGRNNA